MIGDNIQTAISVAKECGILSMEEVVVDVTSMGGEKDRPKIFFNLNLHSQSSRLVKLLNLELDSGLDTKCDD